MPARKPQGLITRHATREEIEARESAENALKPARKISLRPPLELTGHEVASAEWRRLIRLYNSIEAEIISRLDMGNLTDYCLLVEQSQELDDLRRAAFDGYAAAKKIVAAYERDGVDLKILANAVDSMNAIFENIVKLDGRVDRKRALLHTLRQSLYLTPRARAGVAPTAKKKEQPDQFGGEFD